MRRQLNKFRPLKKPIFYCDEGFPQPSMLKFKDFKITHAVIDFRFANREDQFHYQFARKQKAILVTLDGDFLNNQNYRLEETFGVLQIKAGNLPTWNKVNQILDKLMPILKSLNSLSLKNSKISASLEGYVKTSLKDGLVEKQEFNW